MNKQAESKTTFQDKIPSSESAELGASIEKGYKVQLIYIYYRHIYYTIILYLIYIALGRTPSIFDPAWPKDVAAPRKPHGASGDCCD